MKSQFPLIVDGVLEFVVGDIDDVWETIGIVHGEERRRGEEHGSHLGRDDG